MCLEGCAADMTNKLYSFRESNLFTRRLAKLLNDDDYAQLQDYLQDFAEQGAIMVGGGGLRKMRWQAAGRGKSGGLHIIYYLADARGYIYLVGIYAKNEQATLSRSELQDLRRLVEQWLDE